MPTGIGFKIKQGSALHSAEWEKQKMWRSLWFHKSVCPPCWEINDQCRVIWRNSGGSQRPQKNPQGFFCVKSREEGALCTLGASHQGSAGQGCAGLLGSCRQGQSRHILSQKCSQTLGATVCCEVARCQPGSASSHGAASLSCQRKS